MLFALSDANVDFLIIGAYALAFHGMPRATGDIDIFVRATPENADRLWQALLRFGAPLDDFKKEEFSYPKWGITFGREPTRIDLLTEIDGIDFETAWRNRVYTTIEGRIFPVIGLVELLANKRAAGRPKDA